MRRVTSALLSFVLVSVAARAAGAADLPHLKWDQPIRCMRDAHDAVVHVQCEGNECLVAPDRTAEGGELRRAKPCDKIEGRSAYAALQHSGARLVPAIAETQPGFARSETGRAYQVQFDLLDRVYVGAAWTPTFQRPDPRIPTPPGFPFGRARVEIGFEASVLSPHGRSRHDFRVLEGSASFTDLHVNGLLFAYDYQQEHRRPAFYVTSFLGKPRLYPVPIPFGWGFRVLRVEDRPPAFRSALDLEVGEAHISWSPWQSRDLYSHLRVEAGADVGRHVEDRAQGFGSGPWYVGPTGAVRARLSLGEGGLHWLFFDLDGARPIAVTGDLAGRPILRLAGSFAYEGVILAINDQPISVRLAATGGSHEDPATRARSVELGATAGLRFSFWAPPRVFEPLPDLEEP